MSEPEHRAEDDPPQPHLEEGIPKTDPYPRMILVCFAIFFVLLFVILGVLTYDLAQRSEQRVLPGTVRPEAPAPTPPAP